MALVDLVMLPVRVSVAATQVTLGLGELVRPDGPVRRPGGYADRLMVVIGEGGLAERVTAVLTDPNGALALVNALASAVSEDRPLGRALAPGGTLDRLLADDGALTRTLQPGGAVDRVLADDGPVDRLLREDGALERLVAEDGPLERLLAAGGALDRVTRPGGLLDRLLQEEGFLERLTVEGGTLDQLIALGDTLEGIQPGLAQLADLVPELHASVEALNRAVGPLSELANRLPLGRRRSAIEA